MKTKAIRIEDVLQDGGVVKYVMEDGKGECIDEQDHVYYKHETRYDSGQLVDFSEKRKAKDKFDMGDIRYHDYYKVAMRTMKKGEISWVSFG